MCTYLEQQAVGVCWCPVFWEDADELLHVQVYTVNVLLLPMFALWCLLVNYPTSLHCCCCTIHLVLQSTTGKHCKLKDMVQMRISHYNNSVPLWEKFTENTAELSRWLDDVGLSLTVRVSHADG